MCSFNALTMPDFLWQLALPSEITTGRCFLEHYIESILALQEANCKLALGQYKCLIFSNRFSSSNLQVCQSTRFFVFYSILTFVLLTFPIQVISGILFQLSLVLLCCYDNLNRTVFVQTCDIIGCYMQKAQHFIVGQGMKISQSAYPEGVKRESFCELGYYGHLNMKRCE